MKRPTLSVVTDSSEPSGPATMLEAIEQAFERIKAIQTVTPITGIMFAFHVFGERKPRLIAIPASEPLIRGLAEMVYEMAPSASFVDEEEEC